MSGSLTADEARHELYRIMKLDEPFEQKAEQALALGEQYLGVSNGHLTRIDAESEYWKAIASTDSADGQFPPGLTLDLETTYCRRTVQDPPITLHDAPNQGWTDDPAYTKHELDTYHGTALMVDDEPYGTVCFVSSESRTEPFTGEETMFAELLSRMLEHELQHNRTRARVERLDRFASVVSHDLRNPLNIAKGNVGIERKKRDSSHLETAERALDRMDDLIGDVLSIARQGQDVTETESVSLETLADDCWEAVETAAATISVESDYAFQADPQRINNLFENLFRNAIEHGGDDVTVAVGPLPESDGFYIENSGPPIPADAREEIFETGYSTGDEGLGLGLAIVKGIVTAHGWTISVTEGPLGGARFEIRGVVN